MPRNASGTYTLPTGNPVVSGTLIEADWANTTLNDIANELTDSLSRSGEGGMLAPFRLADGLQASPGIAWLNEPSTGFYREGSGEMWGVVGGAQILQYTSAGVLVPTGKTLTANGGTTTTTLTTSGAATLASASVTGNLSVGGTLTLTGGLTLNGNVTVGDSSADTLTINSTITSHLLFTDNTYDIGASGATRPRHLYLAGNGVIGGTLGVSGVLTASGGVTGNLTGNVTGNVTGNISGGTVAGTTGTFSSNVTVGGTLGVTGATTLSSTLGVTGAITASGGVSGNVTGNLTGNVTGSISGGTVAGSTGAFSSNVTVGGTLGVTGIATFTVNPVLSAGTANGVLYLNGSKEATSGSAITYDGTTFKADAAAVFNETGADVDFRIESDTDANAFFLDAGNSRVGINNASPATALDVTGTVTATGLTFPSEGDTITFNTSSTLDARIKTGDSVFTNSLQIEADNGVVINYGQDDTAASADNAAISRGSTYTKVAEFGSNGDISFYEDTGTSAKFFWDASAEALGIGTNSPATQLVLSADNNGIAAGTAPLNTLRFNDTDTILATSQPTGRIEFYTNDSSTGGTGVGSFIESRANGPNGGGTLFFGTSASGTTGTLQNNLVISATGGVVFNGDGEDIDFRVESDTNTHAFFVQGSDGNVGIGTSSPGTLMEIAGGSGTAILRLNNSDTVLSSNEVVGEIQFYQNDASVPANVGVSAKIVGQAESVSGEVGLRFYTGTGASAPERMRLSSDGELLVGGTTEIGAASGIVSIQKADASPTLNLFRNDTSISTGNTLGQIGIYGNDTTSNTPTLHALIEVIASGTHSAGDNPTDIGFNTTPDGTETIAEAGRITQAGSYVLKGGTTTAAAGVGIIFPATQVASANANSLDDYEEGTWTPTVIGSGTPGTYETVVATGNYTKIGRQVTVNATIQLAGAITGGGTGGLRVSGLPFNAGDNNAYGAVMMSGVNVDNNTITLTSQPQAAASDRVLFLETWDNAANSSVAIADVSASNIICFSLTYTV